MGNLSFKYCPVCGEKLKSGKLQTPSERTVYQQQYCSWYSKEDLQWLKEHPVKAVFAIGRKPLRTVVSKKPCIPSGFCTNCRKYLQSLIYAAGVTR